MEKSWRWAARNRLIHVDKVPIYIYIYICIHVNVSDTTSCLALRRADIRASIKKHSPDPVSYVLKELYVM